MSNKARVFTFRSVVVIWVLAIISTLLMVAVIFAWIVLPWWKPELVMAQSPFYQPAYRAALHSEDYSPFIERIELWPDSALADARVALSGMEARPAAIALEVVRRLDPPDAGEILALGLKHPEPEIFRDIVYELATRKDRAHLPTMISEIERRPATEFSGDLPAIGDGLLADLMTSAEFPLTDRLRQSSDPEKRAFTCLLIARLQDRAAVDYLINQLGQGTQGTTDDGLSCDPAAMALGENGSEAATNALAEECSHPDRQRRVHAIRAIGRNGGERLTRALLSAIDGDDQELSREAMRRLACRTDPVALESIDRFLGTTHSWSRWLIPSYGPSLDPVQVPVMVRHLTNPVLGVDIMNAVLGSGHLTGAEADVVLDHLLRLDPIDRQIALDEVVDGKFSPAQRKRINDMRTAGTSSTISP